MKELEEMGVTWGKMQTKALDRVKWLCWIVALYLAMMNRLRLDMMSEDRGHLIIFNWEKINLHTKASTKGQACLIKKTT